ncbi:MULTISPECIES: D-alanyl-D-alanine carboxypeptidase/D-alanyl-D-alanine endopeptidase [Streptosporangium]|uniref:D-alanyl-D-alanine carboxypeptidase/D-alanyl-D-alanine-endopeptidase (Penicillin-binding protein 4) n=1 Tax=Streptosporangium brasiliense TaxID=47480 RepID=A0ABT9R568_9ACTN|nr:D-alanyl-D-alanine carboxypeptidase/D-alanyl-D-alanine-endopeptidase [Streptosporangium brasiliense]MDP9864369.1 D-alanyl-D-alanine carboxypeptidase/D-alanyl-D-alanine-endopeptidase (penicillin-binding protein 4) [Streptosporangium brasiliense]
MRHERWVAFVTLVLLQLFVVAAGAHLLTSDLLVEETHEAAAPAGPPPVPVITASPVLAAGGNGPLPAKTTLVGRLTGALGDPALGKRVGAVVLDAETGATLFGSGADIGVTPASTTKLVTSVASLASLGPDARLSTRVVRGSSPDSIILVGGGDPTLTALRPSGVPVYPQPASLASLALRTARALKAAGTTKVTVTYDDSLYTGPRTAPTWKPNYLPDGEVAPVTALMVDEGRVAPGSRQRVSDPSRAAHGAFVSMLSKQGITVSKSRGRAKAPAGAQEIARVDSAPVYALVERALTRSDNDLSEALARQVAIKEGRPASFDGAAQAVHEVLTRLKAAEGVRVFDGSGLSPKNRIAPAGLARLIAVAAAPANPHLHPIVSGMPVAGFSGTLGHRFGKSDSAYGLVRAKTGTLNGVSTLAGMTTTRSGRLVTFAFMADDIPPGWGKAEAALDRLAAVVAAS